MVVVAMSEPLNFRISERLALKHMQSIYKSGGRFLSRSRPIVWDERKAFENRTKHGVGFETACEAFFDPSYANEDASVEEESRWAVIGMTSQNELLYVVHIEREGFHMRIISARPATKRERRIYEDGC
jgi:uncharacterized protein